MLLSQNKHFPKSAWRIRRGLTKHAPKKTSFLLALTPTSTILANVCQTSYSFHICLTPLMLLLTETRTPIYQTTVSPLLSLSQIQTMQFPSWRKDLYLQTNWSTCSSEAKSSTNQRIGGSQSNSVVKTRNTQASRARIKMGERQKAEDGPMGKQKGKMIAGEEG